MLNNLSDFGTVVDGTVVNDDNTPRRTIGKGIQYWSLRTVEVKDNHNVFRQCYVRTTCSLMNLRNRSRSTLPSKISSAAIPSDVSAGSIE